MTGYGKGDAVYGDKKITVEIRSLNSKQLDVSLKVPSIYRHVEQELRNFVSKSLVRGKIDIYINYESTNEYAGANINQDVFAGYYKQLEKLAEANSIDWSGCAKSEVISAVLRLPDVISASAKDVVPEGETEALLKACRLALSHIESFRKQEGAVLSAEILGRIGSIESLLVQVTPYENARINAIRKRIVENIESLSVPIDNNRLEQELIFYVEKLDITEEKVRLANHCLYFHEVAAEEQDNGRKLGFISQEIGREINTLGSKANDASIQRIVVQMKDELEKIKEQSLNVL